MLSYRHAFHAGNHADVLKHSALLFILDYLRQKETPLLLADTHAGGGLTAVCLSDHALFQVEGTPGRLSDVVDLPRVLFFYGTYDRDTVTSTSPHR